MPAAIHKNFEVPCSLILCTHFMQEQRTFCKFCVHNPWNGLTSPTSNRCIFRNMELGLYSKFPCYPSSDFRLVYKQVKSEIEVLELIFNVMYK